MTGVTGVHTVNDDTVNDVDVLVLRALGIGDFCTGVPALRGLRTRFAGERITLVAPDWLRPLVGLADAVDDLLPLDARAGLTEPLGPIGEVGVAVNLHGRGPESHRLLLATRPSRLLAYACPAAGFHDGPRYASDEHEVERWCRLVTWYGGSADPGDLALRVPAEPPLAEGATVVHPGGRSSVRWPVGRYAEVARTLVALGHDVVVTGSADDHDAHSVGDVPGVRNLVGRTGVAELAALVAAARLVVSGDTGVAHLASAYAVPSVVLFDAMDPRRWGPPRLPRHQVLRHSSGRITAVHPADVVTAADRALSGARPS